jgi:hypothetical protein
MVQYLPVFLLLAITMMGEVEVLHNDQAALAVGEVALNRVAFRRHSGNLQWGLHDELRDGFNGWKRMEGKPIDPHYVALSLHILYGVHSWNHDAKFLLSAQDCQRLGCDLRKAEFAYHNGEWGVFGFREWPRE